MRLIDADELLSKLNEAYKKANAEYHRRALNGFWCGTCSALQEAIREVKEQPTTFDVDKVVEELKRIRAKKTCNKEKCDTKEICRICVVDDAIEIVKQGGVSDDVCKWKYTKEIMDNAEFKVGCNPNALKRGVVPNNFSYHDFKYCPYCGKKIKVVE